jgi:hypothetical protein
VVATDVGGVAECRQEDERDTDALLAIPDEFARLLKIAILNGGDAAGVPLRRGRLLLGLDRASLRGAPHA